MCGIAGAFGNAKNDKIVSDMLDLMIHRGNNSKGIYSNEKIVLAHARLAITGIQDSDQPASNSRKDIFSIINGEIFNYHELLTKLQKRGYNLSILCDTNIIPYLYEEFGVKMFGMINGQFAIAIWDDKKSELILARDRFGQKPLYYRKIHDELYFASEIEPLLEINEDRKVNSRCLLDICTTWAPFDKKTMFSEVFSVNCGEYIKIKDQFMKKTIYYYPQFISEINKFHSMSEGVKQLDLLLRDSITNHTKADSVPAYYLSGGLDSSIIAAIASDNGRKIIDTFSISFASNNLDESFYQNLMATTLKTNHHSLHVTELDIVDAFYECVVHIKTPILRLGVVPMYLLSKYVRNNGFKIVLSGEGADELFGGYDIFKESRIRRLCNEKLDSHDVAKLYNEINTYIDRQNSSNVAALTTFYNQINPETPLSSHLLRFQFGNYCKQFFSHDLKKELLNYSVVDELNNILPANYNEYTDLGRAQYLEIITFMENYLLSSQGDRVAMAHGVECRYPFLDNNIVEFALQLEDKYTINELNEKYILKEMAKNYLPKEIFERKKFPYRAIINHNTLIRNDKISWVLSEQQIKENNVFSFKAVINFLNKIRNKEKITEKELMLLLFICSTQIIASRE